MARILVLGAGQMGTAITTALADNGHRVELVGTHLDTDIIEELLQSRRHPKLPVEIPQGVYFHHHLGLEHAMSQIDLVLLGVNSLGIDWAAEQLRHCLHAEIPLVLLTKGLTTLKGSIALLTTQFLHQLPSQVAKHLPLAAIGGPSIAAEVNSRRPTSVVLAGTDQILLKRIATSMRGPAYRVSVSLDLVGVETCVALKNLYALAVGMVEGQFTGRNEPSTAFNPTATMFTQGLSEMNTFVRFMGGDDRTVGTLSGVGDFFVTCQGGRNARMGRLLGQGLSYKKARDAFLHDETIEGIELVFSIGATVRSLVSQGKLSARLLPVMLHVLDVVLDGAEVNFQWDLLFSDA